MSELKLVQRTQQEVGDMAIKLLTFLEQNGYDYVDLGTHFAVAIPPLKFVEKSALEVPKTKIIGAK